MGTVLRQKKLYDRKIHGQKFTIGQILWLCNPVITKGIFCKLYSPLVGPYDIIKYLSDAVYRIQDIQTPGKRQLSVLID